MEELITELPVPSLTSLALGSVPSFCVTGCRESTGAAEDSQIPPLGHTEMFAEKQTEAETNGHRETHPQTWRQGIALLKEFIDHLREMALGSKGITGILQG